MFRIRFKLNVARGQRHSFMLGTDTLSQKWKWPHEIRLTRSHGIECTGTNRNLQNRKDFCHFLTFYRSGADLERCERMRHATRGRDGTIACCTQGFFSSQLNKMTSCQNCSRTHAIQHSVVREQGQTACATFLQAVSPERELVAALRSFCYRRILFLQFVPMVEVRVLFVLFLLWLLLCFPVKLYQC